MLNLFTVQKNLIPSINFLLSSYSLVIFSSTIFLNAALPMLQNVHFEIALAEADLGASYNKANSPNVSPNSKVFLSSSLIIIYSLPDSVKILNTNEILKNTNNKIQ